jgi:O-antigen/teichoic acid export membrane protein
VRILSFLLLVSAYATQTALPWLARRSRAGDLKRASSRLTLPLVGFGLACVILIWPFAGELLEAIFGASFRVAATSLRWLLLAVFVVYAGSTWLTAVVASGRATTVLWIAGGGLVVNVLGNAILVPVHGMEGAAMATVTTEIFVAAFSLAVLVRVGSRSARPLGA